MKFTVRCCRGETRIRHAANQLFTKKPCSTFVHQDSFRSHYDVQRTGRDSVDSGNPPDSAFESADCGTLAAATLTGTGSERDRRSSLASRGRMFAKRQKRRLVSKCGECNVHHSSVTDRHRMYIADIFTTFVDMRWRYIMLLFVITFLSSWLLFAVLWFAIATRHGDTADIARHDEEWSACVTGVVDFTTALLFSIETQHTIGYGERVVTPTCPEATLLLMLQACFGVLVQSIVTGLVFAKIARPKHRSHTVLFSRFAVICRRDGHLRLLFRIGDMRKSHIVGASVRAVFVQTRITPEGETLPFDQRPFDVQAETSADSYMSMLLPVTVSHCIDSSSPLWDIGAERLLVERFEIVVILDGTVESTGMATQIRTSYLPSEILWGERLAPLLTHQKDSGQCSVDYTRFHDTVPITMPERSAREQAIRMQSFHHDDGQLTDQCALSPNQLDIRWPAVVKRNNGFISRTRLRLSKHYKLLQADKKKRIRIDSGYLTYQ